MASPTLDENENFPGNRSKYPTQWYTDTDKISHKSTTFTGSTRELRGDTVLARLHDEGDPLTPINGPPLVNVDEHPTACIVKAMNTSESIPFSLF